MPPEAKRGGVIPPERSPEELAKALAQLAERSGEPRPRRRRRQRALEAQQVHALVAPECPSPAGDEDGAAPAPADPFSSMRLAYLERRSRGARLAALLDARSARWFYAPVIGLAAAVLVALLLTLGGGGSRQPSPKAPTPVSARSALPALSATPAAITPILPSHKLAKPVATAHHKRHHHRKHHRHRKRHRKRTVA